MYATYLIATILAAVANAYAASLNFAGAESVKVVADRVRSPAAGCFRSARCWPPAPSGCSQA
jgi:hypothetical protein